MRTLYTSKNCAYCHKFKEYLNEIGVDFIEKNISDDQTAMDELLGLGYRSVPVYIDDQKGQTIVGFIRGEVEGVLKKT